MAYLAATLLGVAAWRGIPVELLPDTQLPRLNVNAQWPGASPEATEAFLTSPMEAVIQQVRGVSSVQSESAEQFGFGTTSISIEFALGTDMNFARLEMSERLGALRETLPATMVGPFIQQYVPEEFRRQRQGFMRYTVTGPYTIEALRTQVDDVLVPDLQQVEGVGEVTVSGGRARVLEIELDERRIAALGLTAAQVQQRIMDLEYVREAGVVEVGGLERTVAIRHRANSLAEVRALVVMGDRGRVVRVSDVATVRDTYEDPRAYNRIDGFPAVTMEIHRQPRLNTVATADRVKERLATLETHLPAGVRLILDQDESVAIRTQLTDLRSRAMISAVVIFAVLLLFLQSFRSSLIVFATIGFSIMLAVNLLYWGGFSLNVLTLMGLAMGFGLIVDNAIVVLENVYRRWREGEEPEVAAGNGAREVVLAILAATMTTVVVFIPFVYLQGELRIYYLPLAVAVGFSLLASLLVSFSFIPSLAARLLRSGAVKRSSAMLSGTAVAAGADAGSVAGQPVYVRAHAAVIERALRWPWLAVFLAVAMLGGSYWLFNAHVTRGTLWRPWWSEQSYIDINVRLPRGAELERTDELARYFESRLKEMPEVARFTTNVQPQYAQLRVTFPDELQATSIPLAIKEQLTAYSLLFGGAEVRVYGYGPSFYGGGASSPNYSIQVLGYNYERVRDIAEELGQRLERTSSRVREVNTNATSSWFQRDRASELVMTIDRERLAMHGLTARDLIQQTSAAARGRNISRQVRVGGEEMQLEVKREGYLQLDVQGMEELLIPTRSGSAVRLADVASIDEQEVLGRIRRENQQYERTVTYEFRGPQKLGDRVHETVIGSTQLPEGYTIVARDEWRWSTEEKGQIYGVLAIALFLIFMVAAALFESVRQPFVVLLTVPMALIGVFLIFFYTGASFSREAYIGVIMMGGIVVNNAILLIDRVNQLRRMEGVSLHDAILLGTRQRVKPILMTSASTVLGLLPLVLFSQAADANIWNALGFALIGGLTSSTILVLTVTPALYLLFERRAERRRLMSVEAT
jgi:hydrophobic/amphiphilic exporter-1 (mainly G- bacteria), HAE1 family